MKKLVLTIILICSFISISLANTQVPANNITTNCSTWSKNLNCTMTNQQLVDNAVDQLSASGGSSGFQESFTNSNLSSGILTVNHNLNSQFSIVQVSDNNNTIMLPDKVTLTNSNTTTIDLSSQGTISGTWNVSILPVNSMTPTYSYMLLESSGYLLLENGGKLIL